MDENDTERYWVTYAGMDGVPHTTVIRACAYNLTDKVQSLFLESERRKNPEWVVVTSPDSHHSSAGHPILMLVAVDDGSLVQLNKTTYTYL